MEAALKTIRTTLLKELKTLTQRHARIEAHLHHTLEAPPKDWSELAIFRENDEVLEGLDLHTRAHITAIRRTLSRMEREDWGICAECEKKINPRRLEVLPTATHCVKCAETHS